MLNLAIIFTVLPFTMKKFGTHNCVKHPPMAFTNTIGYVYDSSLCKIQFSLPIFFTDCQQWRKPMTSMITVTTITTHHHITTSPYHFIISSLHRAITKSLITALPCHKTLMSQDFRTVKPVNEQNHQSMTWEIAETVGNILILLSLGHRASRIRSIFFTATWQKNLATETRCENFYLCVCACH